MRMRTRGGYVYILASQKNGTLYIGVTSDVRRAWNSIAWARAHNSFGNIRFLLVWHEYHPLYASAIERETSLKRWKRKWKIRLIEKMNPNWEDLLLTWNA